MTTDDHPPTSGILQMANSGTNPTEGRKDTTQMDPQIRVMVSTAITPQLMVLV